MSAFVFIRQYALTHKDLTAKLKKLETKYNNSKMFTKPLITYWIKTNKKRIKRNVNELGMNNHHILRS